MQRAQVLSLLQKHKPALSERFDVTGLALVGPATHDQASSDSDIDLIVWFDGPATSKRFFGVQLYLQDVLGRPVDLTTEKALREGLRPYVKPEMIRV